MGGTNINPRKVIMTTTALAKLSFDDLVRKVGGTPDNARPVVFPAGNNQFKSPGSYAQDPLSSKQVEGGARRVEGDVISGRNLRHRR